MKITSYPIQGVKFIESLYKLVQFLAISFKALLFRSVWSSSKWISLYPFVIIDLRQYSFNSRQPNLN